MSPVHLQARHQAILDCENAKQNGMELDLDYMTLHHEARLLSTADYPEHGRWPSLSPRFQHVSNREVGCGGAVLVCVVVGVAMLFAGWVFAK